MFLAYNPLNNPIFLPVLLRVVLLFVIGFLIIFAIKKFSMKNFWGSNIGKRYVGWIFIAPIYLAAVFLGGDLSLILMLVIYMLAINEIRKIANISNVYYVGFFLISVVSLIVADYFTSFFYSLPLLYFLIFSFIAVKKNDPERGLFDASLSMFVSIWIIFSLTHFILLTKLNGQFDSSRALLVLIGFAVPLSDIFAYIFGKFFNKIGFLCKYKIASKLSPKKTYIGIIGNVVGALAGIWIMYFAIGHYLPLYHWIIIGVLIGVMGVFGDITESMFKRYFKVKDSGDLIPGHGGVLDRIDSAVRVIVVVYYYLSFFLLV